MDENYFKNEEYFKELDEKQKNIFRLLLCPINVSNRLETKFSVNGNVINSRHTFGTLDPDMSDIAIEFYSIIYKSILNDEPILKNDGTLVNDYYVGDTMNSFNTVARFASKKKKEQWGNSYHCLANFWLLPSNIGRGSNKKGKSSGGTFTNPLTVESFNKGKRDFMDRFLKIEHQYDLEKFAEGHFINGIYVEKDSDTENYHVIEFSILQGDGKKEVKNRMIDAIIDTMMNNICKRAYKIVNNKKICENLYSYFNSINII